MISRRKFLAGCSALVASIKAAASVTLADRMMQIYNATGVATDTYWQYVTALMHFDGTNGAANSTFLDSSTSALTITTTGTVAQGTFSPFGEGWSNLFDGSTGYLTGPSGNAAYKFTTDFTAEAWIFPTSSTGSPYIFDTRISAGTDAGCWLYIQVTTNSLIFGAAATTYITGSTAVTLHTWSHVAVVRSSTTITLYLNGVSIGSTTTALTSTAGGCYIGRAWTTVGYFSGYISNLRFNNTTAVYTSGFTPPTSALTATTGTSFLTCQSNRFIDNSASALTLTVNGTVKVQPLNPFAITSAYSAATNGGSLWSDGSTGYLTVTQTASQVLSSNFTIETWFYQTGSAGAYYFVSAYGSSGQWQLVTQSTNSLLIFYYTSASFITSSTAYSFNCWNHVAVVRNSGTITMYLNGVSVASVSNASTLGSSGQPITTASFPGGNGGSGIFPGYISNVRITTTAVYTAGFTPPTAPLTAITGTVLLESFTNAGIFDQAMNGDFRSVSGAAVSTSQAKFGTGSIAFSGSNYFLGIPGPAYQFYGDFTIEMWVYPTAYPGTGANAFIYDGRSSTSGIALALTNLSGTQNVSVGGQGGNTTTVYTTTLNAWSHFALVRQSGTTKLYINGSLISSDSIHSGNMTDGNLCLGTFPITPAGSYFTGYIDDFRITNGVARYTTTFTPPTAAFPNI
jgi:hypothetical protein